MLRIILKIGLILTVVFVIDHTGSLYLDSLYQKNEGSYANGHLNYYLHKIEPDTLFIGSSRTENHIDTRLFSQNVYNLSHASMHIGFQAALLDVLEQKRKLPKNCLVLQLEANELQKYSSKELRKDIHYLNYYYDKNKFVKSEIDKISLFESVKHWSWLYRFSGYASILITNPIQKINQKPTLRGYIPLQGQQFEFEEELPSIGINNFFFYLNHIHTICKRNNIQLICFTAPYFENDQLQYKRNKQLGKTLTAKGILYFNFASLRKDVPKLYKDNSNWYNAIHLNEQGAEIFTQIIKDSLQP